MVTVLLYSRRLLKIHEEVKVHRNGKKHDTQQVMHLNKTSLYHVINGKRNTMPALYQPHETYFSEDL